MAADVTVRGLKQLRRDLRALGPAEARELTDELRETAQLVADRARSLAPRKSGRLAASIKPSGAGTKVAVRSTLPYANVQHWGGTIRPKGSPIRIVGTRFITRAAESMEQEIIDRLAEGVDRVAGRHGWR